jgi:pilus assembly protein CpaE
VTDETDADQILHAIRAGADDVIPRGSADSSEIAAILARHEPSGLMLLTLDGGSGAEPSGIAPADIAALIRLLRACCGDVVLCVGSLRHSGLLRTLASLADHIDLLCAQSIREMEACRRLLERVGQDEAMRAKTQLLVWDHQPGILLDSRRMADVLQTGSVLPLPIDPVRARNALNAGRPLAMEGAADRYMRAIRQACGVDARLSTKGLDRLRRLLQRPVEPLA